VRQERNERDVALVFCLKSRVGWGWGGVGVGVGGCCLYSSFANVIRLYSFLEFVTLVQFRIILVLVPRYHNI
jgi:hypothetical protein